MGDLDETWEQRGAQERRLAIERIRQSDSRDGTRHGATKRVIGAL